MTAIGLLLLLSEANEVSIAFTMAAIFFVDGRLDAKVQDN